MPLKHTMKHTYVTRNSIRFVIVGWMMKCWWLKQRLRLYSVEILNNKWIIKCSFLAIKHARWTFARTVGILDTKRRKEKQFPLESVTRCKNKEESFLQVIFFVVASTSKNRLPSNVRILLANPLDIILRIRVMLIILKKV